MAPREALLSHAHVEAFVLSGMQMTSRRGVGHRASDTPRTGPRRGPAVPMWLRTQVLGALNLFRCSLSAAAWCDLLADPVGVRRRIGYVGQAGGAGPDCLVLDELVLQGMLYGLPPEQARARGRELLGQLDPTGTERRLAGTLSGGQRRRLDIAMGPMHVPGLPLRLRGGRYPRGIRR